MKTAIITITTKITDELLDIFYDKDITVNGHTVEYEFSNMDDLDDFLNIIRNYAKATLSLIRD